MPPPSPLPAIPPRLKSGEEAFTLHNQPVGPLLIDFWRWSVSDLISNATRGKLAEFIVAHALGIDTTQVRDEWAAYDLESPEGIKIEVKASAYIQSWEQRQISRVTFSIAPARIWNSFSNTFEEQKMRAADVYVFCLHKHQDSQTINPLYLDQWAFYVVATALLNEWYAAQKSINLKALQKLVDPVGYIDLRSQVFRLYSDFCNKTTKVP